MSSRGRGPPFLVIGIVVAALGLAALATGGLVWLTQRLGSRGSDVGLGVEPTEIVDTSLRFRLRDPGREWLLLDAADARLSNPDACAGLVKIGGGARVVLIVEPAYGHDLKRSTDAVLHGTGAEGATVGPTRSVTIAGQRGATASRRATMRDLDIHQQIVVFVHQDHIYQLVVVRIGAAPAAADVAVAMAALEILPGRVVDRVPARSGQDRIGPLWKLQRGVLTSAAHRLRVEENADWRALAGGELGLLDPNAEVGVQRALPPVTLTANASPRPGADVEAERARLYDAFRARFGVAESDAGIEVPAVVDGRTLTFRRHRIEQRFAFDYVHGVLNVDGWSVELIAWSPARGAIDRQLTAALGRVHVVSDADARALEASNDHEWEDGLGTESATRRGRFRSYRTGLSWTAPGPCWRVWTGAEALAREADASMVGECPRLGIRAVWWSLDRDLVGDTPEETHDEVAASLFGDVDAEPTSVENGNARGMHTDGTYEIAGVRYRYLIRTFERPDRIDAVAVYHPDIGSESTLEAARAILAFQFELRPPIESAVGRYVHRRLGFGFSDPSLGVMFQSTAPPGIGALSDVATAVTGDDAVVVIAVHLPDSDDEDVAIPLMQETLLGSRRASFLQRSRATSGTLGGRPCRVLEIDSPHEHQSLRLLRRGRTIYGMLVTSARTPDANEIAGHWVWPDP